MSLEIGERRRMERELRTMQDRYRSLVENMPGIGHVWDIHPGAHRRDLSYVSPRVRRSSVRPRRLGTVRSRPPARPGERRKPSIERATGAPFFMEYRFLASDGSVVWCWITPP